MLPPGHASGRTRKAAPSPRSSSAWKQGFWFASPPGSILVSQQGIRQTIKDTEILDAESPAATPDTSSEDESSPLADADCIYPGAGQAEPPFMMKLGGRESDYLHASLLSPHLLPKDGADTLTS